jgi:GNAT superfamily N-acetyltransferase
MTAFAYRVATVADAADIFAVLQVLAAEIPVLLDTLEREEAMYARVRNWARSGESWVAVDGEDRIVAFVLAELNQVGRFWGEHEVIDLHYAGVAQGHRNQGIFGALMRQILGRMVPVTVTVSAANRSPIVRRLERLGFRRAGPGVGEQQFRWKPGADRA